MIATKVLLVARSLILLDLYVQKSSEPPGFAFIPHMECLERSDEVDKALGSICIRYGNNGKVEYTLEAQVHSKAANDAWGERVLVLEPFYTIEEQLTWSGSSLDFNCLQKV